MSFIWFAVIQVVISISSQQYCNGIINSEFPVFIIQLHCEKLSSILQRSPSKFFKELMLHHLLHMLYITYTQNTYINKKYLVYLPIIHATKTQLTYLKPKFFYVLL